MHGARLACTAPWCILVSCLLPSRVALSGARQRQCGQERVEGRRRTGTRQTQLVTVKGDGGQLPEALASDRATLAVAIAVVSSCKCWLVPVWTRRPHTEVRRAHTVHRPLRRIRRYHGAMIPSDRAAFASGARRGALTVCARCRAARASRRRGHTVALGPAPSLPTPPFDAVLTRLPTSAPGAHSLRCDWECWSPSPARLLPVHLGARSSGSALIGGCSVPTVRRFPPAPSSTRLYSPAPRPLSPTPRFLRRSSTLSPAIGLPISLARKATLSDCPGPATTTSLPRAPAAPPRRRGRFPWRRTSLPSRSSTRSTPGGATSICHPASSLKGWRGGPSATLVPTPRPRSKT